MAHLDKKVGMAHLALVILGLPPSPTLHTLLLLLSLLEMQPITLGMNSAPSICLIEYLQCKLFLHLGSGALKSSRKACDFGFKDTRENETQPFYARRGAATTGAEEKENPEEPPHVGTGWAGFI